MAYTDAMHVADDTSFNRLALKAPLPAVALFHGGSCELSRSASTVTTRTRPA